MLRPVPTNAAFASVIGAVPIAPMIGGTCAKNSFFTASNPFQEPTCFALRPLVAWLLARIGAICKAQRDGADSGVAKRPGLTGGKIDGQGSRARRRGWSDGRVHRNPVAPRLFNPPPSRNCSIATHEL